MAQYDQSGVRALPVPTQRAASPQPAQQRPTAPQAGASTAAAAPPPPTINWQDDPILVGIQAGIVANNAAADASAAAARTQALIRYGYDPSMAGLYGDSTTEAAAKSNQFSTLANLAHAHDLRSRGLDQNMNARNLFYSTARGTAIGEEGRQALSEQDTAGNQLRDLLGGIEGQRLGAHQQGTNALGGAQSDAYQRALDFGLKYGTGDTSAAAGAGGGAVGSALRQAIVATPKKRPVAPSRTALLRSAPRRP